MEFPILFVNEKKKQPYYLGMKQFKASVQVLRERGLTNLYTE